MKKPKVFTEQIMPKYVEIQCMNLVLANCSVVSPAVVPMKQQIFSPNQVDLISTPVEFVWVQTHHPRC